MINVLPQIQPRTVDLFENGNTGLFEINEVGMVLYCRTSAGKLSPEKSVAVIGRNFFYEVAPFENMEDLRRHFNNFVKSGSPTKKFSFNCLIKNQNIPAKIMLVQITERENSGCTNATIVDIRKI